MTTALCSSFTSLHIIRTSTDPVYRALLFLRSSRLFCCRSYQALHTADVIRTHSRHCHWSIGATPQFPLLFARRRQRAPQATFPCPCIVRRANISCRSHRVERRGREPNFHDGGPGHQRLPSEQVFGCAEIKLAII
ncbi:uncharacterized protein M421DRAFT_134945 [Didymella exigua CBS 183.55]|uniref:Uncharacterized protein n=1 Tax=Didymella exigua CBS 183.55 TaxID=1150837 RepID=A0A6A5RN96_9PLEO|nr:uncharacterized protein M421DRAFT_134945 [Didymella exigua CBS 183.55]KAF1929242.1 hypothetical protein M421DRAFT_134945 [Didymella exigua CBS 183.55]